MWMHGWLLIQRGSREVRAEPSGQGVCWDRATSWCEPSVHSATRFRGVLRPFGIRLPSRQGTKKVFYGGPSGSATRCNVQCERDGAVGSAGGNRGSAGLFCQMHLRTVGTAPITKAGEKNPKQRKRLGKSLKEPPARWRQRTIPLAGVPRSFPRARASVHATVSPRLKQCPFQFIPARGANRAAWRSLLPSATPRPW